MKKWDYTANSCWLALTDHVLRDGEIVTARGRDTREVLAFQSVWPMEHPLVSVAARQIGYRFAFAEAYWICSGCDRLDELPAGRDQLKMFSDDGVKLYGAYGIPFREQLDHVVTTLAADIFSRQAVINIWRENPIASKDIPCTLSWQFLIREKNNGFCLDVVSTMRSSDVWLGVPYDIFTLTQVACQVALELAQHEPKNTIPGSDSFTILVPHPGKIYLTAGSQHVYGENVIALQDLLEEHRNLQQVDQLVSRELPNIPFSFSELYASCGLVPGSLGDTLVSEYFGKHTYKMTPSELHQAWLWLVAKGYFDDAALIYRWVVPAIKDAYVNRLGK